jgi:hypothetical protein
MKLSIEAGSVDVWMLVPLPVVIYHPDEKRLEIGLYFLKYFLTANIKQ